MDRVDRRLLVMPMQESSVRAAAEEWVRKGPRGRSTGIARGPRARDDARGSIAAQGVLGARSREVKRSLGFVPEVFASHPSRRSAAEEGRHAKGALCGREVCVESPGVSGGTLGL